MLRRNVAALLESYADLQRQVGVLTTANESQHEEIMRSHAELIELRKQYNDLRTVHALSAGGVSAEDKERARRQIAALITKVDKALELVRAE